MCVLSPFLWLDQKTEKIQRNCTFITESLSFLVESFYPLVSRVPGKPNSFKGSENGPLLAENSKRKWDLDSWKLTLYSRSTICQFIDYSKGVLYSILFISIMCVHAPAVLSCVRLCDAMDCSLSALCPWDRRIILPFPGKNTEGCCFLLHLYNGDDNTHLLSYCKHDIR